MCRLVRRSGVELSWVTRQGAKLDAASPPWEMIIRGSCLCFDRVVVDGDEPCASASCPRFVSLAPWMSGASWIMFFLCAWCTRVEPSPFPRLPHDVGLTPCDSLGSWSIPTENLDFERDRAVIRSDATRKTSICLMIGFLCLYVCEPPWFRGVREDSLAEVSLLEGKSRAHGTEGLSPAGPTGKNGERIDAGLR